jgi:hypothetical protein
MHYNITSFRSNVKGGTPRYAAPVRVLECSWAELDRVLTDPFASELSAATGTAALVVRGEPRLPHDAGARATRARCLRSLACVSIAVGDEGAPDAEPFDVVASEARVEPVVAHVVARPMAALGLAQLLRADLDVAAALDAESWIYGLLQSGPEFGRWLAGRHDAPERPLEREVLLVEEHPGVCRLVLNRPRVRNALNTALRERLVEVLRSLEARPETAIELTGAGPAFCAGGDLSEFGTFPDPVTAHVVRCTRSPARWLARLGSRLTARVHGACAGGGAELAAFAHRVEARADAVFHLPEVAMGLIPGAGGTVSIRRRIGRQRTAWLGLSGERIDAATALAWGLIDAIV